VLTIAHRLHTIVDSDRILLLEGGQLAEFGSPAQLLRNPDSHFRSLVEETMRGGGATGDVVGQAFRAANEPGQ
jgi:ABC-type multidrug transport system fused ATPase/permease subunit